MRQCVRNNNPPIIFETAKQSVKITVIFVPELCKMVRHKLILCSFELWITYTLLQNYTAARCFCMAQHCGAVFFVTQFSLWRSFLLLGLRGYSALHCEDYERCICWVTALPFLWCFKNCDTVTQLYGLWDRCGGRI